MKKVLWSLAFLASMVVLAFAVLPASAATSYKTPPTTGAGVTVQWNWIISNKITPAIATGGTYNVLDTDEFFDNNGEGANGDPNAPSTLVADMHSANKYAVCYMEAGAYQTGFDDDANFASADYGGQTSAHQMKGYPNEYWFDTRGFGTYNGTTASLNGAAVDIAQALNQRIQGCAAEGQDALEPDDLDGYDNKSASGGAGGGWGITQADSAGFERWLADTAHNDGLAALLKNDTANVSAVAQYFDGAINEQCNQYSECDTEAPFYNAHKPVYNAEYSGSTGTFCPKDAAVGITGALFSVDLDNSKYSPCTTGSGYVYGSGGTTSTTTTTPTTSTSTTTTPTTSTTSSTTSTVTTTPTSTTTTSTTTTPAGKPPVNQTAPRLSGTTTVGSTLSTTAGSWSQHPTSYKYQWFRCANKCTAISGATSSSYTLTSADQGDQLYAQVTASNAVGSGKATTNNSKTVAKAPAKKSRVKMAQGHSTNLKAARAMFVH